MIIKLHCSVILGVVQLQADCNCGLLRVSKFCVDLTQMTTDTVSKRGKKWSRLDRTAQSCASVVLSSVQICSAQLSIGFHWGWTPTLVVNTMYFTHCVDAATVQCSCTARLCTSSWLLAWLFASWGGCCKWSTCDLLEEGKMILLAGVTL
jgi:hypothetical protein